MNGTRHYTARLYTPRRNGKEVSALPPPPPSKIVFLDGFNEYRMFIVTIPCDSHKRQKSTSTLPPLLCTLPTLPSLPPPIPQSTTKEEEGVGKKKKIKFVVKRSRIVVLSVCFRLRSLLDKQSMVLRCNKEWRKLLCSGGERAGARERDETRCAAKRFLTTPHQGGTQFVCYFCFLKLQK